MNVFQDDDGKAYVIYCDHGDHGVKGGTPAYTIRIDSLSEDYLTSNQDGIVVFEKGCEAPAMVKHKGKYLAVASGVHGWAGSETVCATADAPLGPWKRQENISERRTWNSQVTDLIHLEESDTVMALCDQWWIPDKSDINKSRYLFLPLRLDPATGKVKMEYREKWSPLSREASKAEADQKQTGKFFDQHHIVIGEHKETPFTNRNGVSPDGTMPMYRDTSGKLWAMCGHSHLGHIAMFSGTRLDDMKKAYPISTNFCVGHADHAFSGVRYPEGVKPRGSIWPFGLYICPNM
jgi:hypothetical protein